MNEVSKEQLLWAIQALFHETNEDQRKKAQKLCSDVLDNQQIPHGVAYSLFHDNYPDETRNFGLLKLHRIITDQWPSLPPEEQAAIKGYVVPLIGISAGYSNQPKYIVNKLASVITALVVREWPQRWPNLLDILAEEANKGTGQLTVVLRAYGTLFDEISTFHSDIPSARRNDLSTAAAVSAPQVCKGIRQYLDFFFPQLSSLPKDSPEFKPVVEMVQECLEVLQSLLPLSPVPAFIEPSLHRVCLDLLQVPAMRDHSAKCLTLMIQKKGLPDQASALRDMTQAIVSYIQECTQANPNFMTGSLDNEEEHSFHKLFWEMFVSIGDVHMSSFETRPYATLLLPYIQILVALIGHHSFIVSASALQTLRPFLRNTNEQIRQVMTEAALAIVERLSQKCLKVGDPDLDNHPSCTLSVIDFEGHDEFATYYAMYRGMSLDIIKLATELRSDEVLAHALASVQQALSQQGNVGNEGVSQAASQPGPDGQIPRYSGMYSPSYLLLEGAHFVLGAVITASSHYGQAGSQNIERFTEEGLRMVLQFETVDPLLISVQCALIKLFVPYLKHTPGLLGNVLEKLLGFMQPGRVYVDSADMQSGLSKNGIAARRKACTTLVVVGSALSTHLVPHFENLTTRVQSLYATLRSQERILLLESLAAMSNSLPDPQRQKEFLHMLLADALSHWQSQEFQQAVTSLSSFIKYVGLDTDNPVLAATDNNTASPHNVLNSLLLFTSVRRRVKARREGTNVDPLASYVEQILPSTFHLVSCLHALYTPEGRSLIKDPGVLELSEMEKSMFLMGERPSQDELKTGRELVQYWLNAARHASYMLLGLATRSVVHFYTQIPLLDNLRACVFNGFHAVTDRHSLLLVRHVLTPLLAHAPTETLLPVLYPILPTILSSYTQRLQASWTSVLDTEKQSQSTTEEVIATKILRDATRAYADLLTRFLRIQPVSGAAAAASKGPTHVITKGPESLDPNRVAFSLHDDMAMPVMTAITALLRWPDSHSLSRIISLCTGLMPHLLATPAVHEFLASEFFRTIIQCLTYVSLLDGPTMRDVYLLIQQIYSALVASSPQIRQTLMSLPGVDEPALVALMEQLSRTNGDKGKTAAMKNFLGDRVRAATGTMQAKSVQNIPGKLHVNRPIQVEVHDDYEVPSLFD